MGYSGCYRHIDAAIIYENQMRCMFNNIFPIPFITHGAYIQVGNALKKVIPSVVKREDSSLRASFGTRRIGLIKLSLSSTRL